MFQKARDLQPDNPVPYTLDAEVLKQLQMYREAVAVLRKAHESDPRPGDTCSAA